MGGHRFERQLATPRIRPELYFRMKAWAIERIEPLFAKAAMPTELPEKPDYGDIDFLVAGPLNHTKPVLEQVKEALGAVRAIDRGIDGILYFAVKAIGAEHHVQIDVKVCHDVAKFDWMLWRLQYATASMLIGSMVNPLGLTLDDDGLHIRVKELEDSNWNASMIFLTENPRRAMETLGYNSEKWEKLGTVEEVYLWLESSWVFSAQHFFHRLQDLEYRQHLEDRCKLQAFVLDWLPSRYPFEWILSKRRRSRTIVSDTMSTQDALKRFVAQERILGMFPDARTMLEVKGRAAVKQTAEALLREKIIAAIPMSIFAPDPMGRPAAFALLMRFIGVSTEHRLYTKEEPEEYKFKLSWSECGIPEHEIVAYVASESTVAEIWRRQSLRINEGRKKRMDAKKAAVAAVEDLEIGVEDSAN